MQGGGNSVPERTVNAIDAPLPSELSSSQVESVPVRTQNVTSVHVGQVSPASSVEPVQGSTGDLSLPVSQKAIEPLPLSVPVRNEHVKSVKDTAVQRLSLLSSSKVE